MTIKTWAAAVIGLAMVAGLASAQDQPRLPSRRIQPGAEQVTVPLRQPSAMELRADIAALSNQIAELTSELRTVQQALEAQSQSLAILREREAHRFYALVHYTFNGCTAAMRAIPMLNLSWEQARADCLTDTIPSIPHLEEDAP